MTTTILFHDRPIPGKWYVVEAWGNYGDDKYAPAVQIEIVEVKIVPDRGMLRDCPTATKGVVSFRAMGSMEVREAFWPGLYGIPMEEQNSDGI